MTFDETLQRAFETLTDQLRDEIARQLAQARTELAAAAAAERDAAVEQAKAAARDAVEGDLAARVAAAESEAAVRLADAEREAAARLTDAVASAEAAARERASADADARVRDAEQRASEAVDAARTALAAQASAAAVESSTRLLDAVRTIDRGRSLTEILDVLVTHASHETTRVGVLLARGRTLRGWRFVGFEPPIESDYEVAVDQAGVAAEALQSGAAVAAEAGENAAGPVFGSLADGRRRLAVPIELGGQYVAVVYADEGPNSRPSANAPTNWQETLEILTRHAAHRLEAITAFQTARMLTERPEMLASNPPSAAVPTRDDEHEAARRYARLLVSEIKLYHEPAVVTGRKERDLATRLGGEIARARVLYEQRVPAAARAETDHFHAELVRTLAGGDATLLEAKSEK